MNKEDILKTFKAKNIKFELDIFETIYFRELGEFDERAQIKLNSDFTSEFNNSIKIKIRHKKQIKIVIKGATRSGKSLIGLKLLHKLNGFYDMKFNAKLQICADQNELRKKLKREVFGESFQIDEKAFTNVGLGSNTEIAQLVDINDQIAKNNNHLIYITPRSFIDVGAEVGLEYYGTDFSNWLSRFLVWYQRGGNWLVMGYVVFDIGALFIENGCLIYRKTGGCTNTNRLKSHDIDKDFIKYSSCVPDDFNKNDLEDEGKTCPFYKICTSEMCSYEQVKDKWISKAMKGGGIAPRQAERNEIIIKLFINFFDVETNRLDCSLKSMPIELKLKIPELTSTQLTGTELKEIQDTLIALIERPQLLATLCKTIQINYQYVLKLLGSFKQDLNFEDECFEVGDNPDYTPVDFRREIEPPQKNKNPFGKFEK